MNAIKFEDTRYGFKAQVAGLTFQLRRVNRPDEPGLYSVYSTDYDQKFLGDLIDARHFLNTIARNYADCMAS